MTDSNPARLDIEIHGAGPDWAFELVDRERSRRLAELVAESSQDSETSYFGIEVGNERRYFEGILRAYIRPGKNLLDYGCGGARWKDYWSIPSHVTGVDVVLQNLESLRAAFPDRTRFRLIYATAGITALPDSAFDQILSSSVVGYIHPKLAEIHVHEIARLLRPSGIAMFTRINAANYATPLRGRFVETGGGFAYRYSRRELRRLIEDAGMQTLEMRRIGLHIPLLRRQVQRLYGSEWFRRLDAQINCVPGFAVHHLIIATRREMSDIPIPEPVA